MQFMKIAALLLLIVTQNTLSKDMVIGSIEPDVTATNICNSLEEGDSVTLRSGGGSVSEAKKLVSCIRDKNILVKVDYAYSAASFIAFGGKRVCLMPTAAIGVHSPHIPHGNHRVNLSVTDLRSYFTGLGRMMITQGYSNEDVYFIIGVTFMTAADKMTTLPNKLVVTLLKDRYQGICG